MSNDYRVHTSKAASMGREVKNKKKISSTCQKQSETREIVTAKYIHNNIMTIPNSMMNEVAQQGTVRQVG